MGVLDKLRHGSVTQQAKRLPLLDANAAEHLNVDRWQLDDLKRAGEGFKRALETPVTWTDENGRLVEYEPSLEIHEDIFLGSHTPGDSRVKDAEQVRPSHRFGRDVLDEFFKTEAHREAKPYTESDPVAAGIYTRAAMQKFDELMSSQAVREQAEQSQQAQDLEQQIDQAQQQIDDLRGQAQQAAADGQPVPGNIAGDMRAAIEQREQAAQQLQQVADQIDQQGLPQDVKTAVRQAAQEGQEKADTWSAIAGIGGDAVKDATPDEAWSLAEQWEQINDFRELVKLIGRVNRDFRSQEATRVTGGDDEVIGVELGNNLTNVLPSELAQLGASEALTRKFLKDFVDEDLLQFETQGREKIELGPGVICIDLSGSMGTVKAREAKAVAVGFVKLMHRKNRDAVVIVFQSSVIWEHHFKAGKPIDMPNLLKLAGLRSGGGTTIARAVERGAQYIEKGREFDKADLIVATDGADGSNAVPTMTRLREKGVRSLGIAIGHEPGPGGWLDRHMDQSISVASLTDATGDIVKAVT